jgi:probable O-glycosylation ligase (exosortase A-associated)
MWITGGLLALAVTTLPLSEWTGGSVKTLLDLYVKALIIFWLLTCTVTTLGRLRVVAWSLSLMAAPLAVTGVRNFLSHPEASRIIGYEAPLTTNPNDLALMLNLILPLTVALFVVNQRAVVRGLLAGLIVLDASAIVVTFSRGGFLALATTLVLYLRTLHRRRQSRWVVAALALVLAALPALPPGYLDRLGTITNIQADQTGSAQVRWEDTWTAFTFALGHPVIGAGLGMNQIGPKSLLGVRVQPVHNVYLEYAVDMGWPGLGLFLLLLVSCISTVTRLCKRCAGLPALQELSALAEAIRIALVAFAVAGLFHPVAYHFYFYYFAGLAIATRTIYESEARFDSGVPASALTR